MRIVPDGRMWQGMPWVHHYVTAGHVLVWLIRERTRVKAPAARAPRYQIKEIALKPRVLVGSDARLGDIVARLLPSPYDWLVGKLVKGSRSVSEFDRLSNGYSPLAREVHRQRGRG